MEQLYKTINRAFFLLVSLVFSVAHIGCNDALASGHKAEFESYIVDIENETTYPGRINVLDGKIESIEILSSVSEDAPYYLPGLTDSHIHIESLMLTPVNFSKVAVCHGVVNSVSDPHEITNVLGVDGVDFMVHNAKATRFNCYFGVAKAKGLDCELCSPFITMAFMALPVIPELKIADKGLVDVNAFDFTTVEVE